MAKRRLNKPFNDLSKKLKRVKADTDNPIILIVFFLSAGLMWLFGAAILHEEFFKISPEKAGQFGDMFGAINTLFSGLAFAGILYTILLQKRELRETRNEFVEQNQTLKQQRFENTFFNMLALFNQLINNLHYQHMGTRFEGKHFITNFFHQSKSLFPEKGSVNKPAAIEFYTKQLDHYLGIKQYFENLFTLLSYIKGSILIRSKDKELYFSIVRSLLSDQEKVLLFYHVSCQANTSTKIKRFQDILVEHRFLSSINADLMFSSNHMFELNDLRDEVFKRLNAQ